MELTMLKGKIHRATVTQAELDYVGRFNTCRRFAWYGYYGI